MYREPNREYAQGIDIRSLQGQRPDMSLVIHDATTQAVTTIGDDPNASHSDTVGLPIQRAQATRLKRFTLPLLALAALMIFITGGAMGYAVGKSRASKVNLSNAGWMLTTATINGAPVATPEKVYLAWDVAATPHDLGAEWCIINPSAAHPLVAVIPIDAASNGQGGVTVTLHAGAGEIVITGTLVGNTLQLVIPPGSHLFPAANTAFVTLTFAPSSTSAFNQLVGGA